MSDVSENPVFDIAMAYQKTAALTAAVRLNLFSVIGEKAVSLEELSASTQASERGLRILCDYLTVIDLLAKQGSNYSLTQVARTFLDEGSPLAMGKIVDFVAAPETLELFLADPASYVRRGGASGLANVSPDHPVWIRFAKAAAPFAATTAKRVAAHVATFPELPYTVLDIAAGHGLFGIEVAKVSPEALVTAVDWAAVLTVAQTNAEAAGVADRFNMLPGNALEIDWGSDFDLVLLPNFLHHFDFATCTALLRKVKASLAPGGHAFGIDLVPNEDRVSPPTAATFAFFMLATTPGGDAYTASEFDHMARDAGFRGATVRPLAPTPQSLITFEAD
jgi:predicted nicotinamide N-methyase